MKYWIGVASKDHVMIGVAGGFCQLGHGKQAPLLRMKAGDKIFYYAPKVSLTQGEPCQKIIALATLSDDIVYSLEVNPDFKPYRRNVSYASGLNEVSLHTLNSFSAWAEYRSKLRFGHFEITKAMFDDIYRAMTDEGA